MKISIAKQQILLGEIKIIMKFEYKKILIIGCGGAGKSTLARLMGEKFNLPITHLDKLHWLPGWNERPEEEFINLVENVLAEDSWIIDGNYGGTFEIRLKFADFCIFLDYPTEVCIQGVLNRVKTYNGKTRPDMTEVALNRLTTNF